MPTQQETIKEMSKKKLLTGEQRKVLYRLFEAKIINLLISFRSKKSDERDEFENQLLEDGRKDPAIKEVIDKIENCKKTHIKYEKIAEKIGFEITNDHLSDKKIVDIALGYNTQHPKLNAFDKKRDKQIAKIEDLKLKLLADIHGLPLTYEELTDYVEKEIAKIEVE